MPALRPEDLNVETSGPEAGLPVLLLHGWGSSARLMRPLAERLSAPFRVYNVDLPGHGHSPPPPAPWSVPEHAALVHRLITERVPEEAPVTIIGHSNGGRIALYMATEPGMAGRIRRLVLVSPSGIRPERPPGVRLKAGLAKALKAPLLALPEPLRTRGLDWLRHSLVWKALGSSDYRALAGVMRETFVKTLNFHLDDRLERITAPVLLFWGDEDTAVSRRQMQLLEEKIPDAGLVVLEGAGHYGYLDAPETFFAATTYFLEHS